MRGIETVVNVGLGHPGGGDGDTVQAEAQPNSSGKPVNAEIGHSFVWGVRLYKEVKISSS